MSLQSKVIGVLLIICAALAFCLWAFKAKSLVPYPSSVLPLPFVCGPSKPVSVPDFQPQIQKLEVEKQEAHKEAAKARARMQALETALEAKASDLAKARARMQAALKAEQEAKEASVIQPEPTLDLPLWATNKLEAQANLITTLETNLREHIERGDAWKKSSERWKVAFEQSEKQNECLKIAHQAQLSAIKSARWKGRLEGFAVGLGTGFIGAKLK